MKRSGGSLKNLMAEMEAKQQEQERDRERRMGRRLNPQVEEDTSDRPAA